MKVYIVRSAERETLRDGLTARGKRQAALLSEEIASSVLVCGPEGYTRETAEICARKWGKEVSVLRELQPLSLSLERENRGDFYPVGFPVRAENPFPPEAYGALRAALSSLLAQYGGEEALAFFCTFGGGAAIASCLCGTAEESFLEFSSEPASFCELVKKETFDPVRIWSSEHLYAGGESLYEEPPVNLEKSDAPKIRVSFGEKKP